MKIKYDVTGQDPADSVGKSFEDPKPGVYKAKVKEIKPGFSKDESTGQPDKNRPRIEVVYEITQDPYKGSRLWDYISQNEASKWRLDQFLLAIGVSQKKRKGDFDTDEYIGMPVKVRVKGDSQTVAGEQVYRARVGAVMAGDDEDVLDDDELDEEEVDEEELDDSEIDEESEDDEEESEEDEDSEESEDEDLYTREDLDELSMKDLTTILKDEFDQESVPRGKDPKIDLILQLQGGEDAEDEGDEEDEEDEEEDLSEKSLAELKALAKELEISTAGSKTALIKRIQKAWDEEPI